VDVVLIRIVIAVVLWTVAAPAMAQQRIALIVTNQSYTQPGAKLENTHADGDLIKAALERVGFRVWTVRDTRSEGELLKAIGDHAQRLTDAGPEAVGFFYYSGHGAADRPDGANYLIPTEAPLTHVNQLPLMALRLDKITSTLAAVAKMSFVVFDACRNVALQRETRDFGFKGFAPIREQRGLLVAYATEPGNVAIDQSIYARALADEIVKPGLEAGQVFRSVTRRVVRETEQKQAPEYLDKRLDDFHFVASASAQTASLEAPSLPLPAAAPTPPLAPCDGIEVDVAGGARQCIKPGSGKTTWFKDCPTCPEMVVVPAGTFTMGSPANEPDRSDNEDQVQVTLSQPFAVGRFAVTRGEFASFVADTGYKTDGGCYTSSGTEVKLQSDRSWRSAGFAQDDRHPVVCVNWDDAKAYAAWLSAKTGKTYRLPSESEREYVTRAGTTTPFWWGSSITPNQANYDGSAEPNHSGGSKGEYRNGTVPVDSFEANPWGLYNVHGNVYDWTEDCWSDKNASNPRDGSARKSRTCTHRTQRGASWADESDILRSASRIMILPEARGSFFGFRLARNLIP